MTALAVREIQQRWTVAERQAACVHDWRWAGSHPPEPIGCQSPVRICCVRCSLWFVKSCGRTRTSACGHCSGIKRGDVAACARSGWSDRPTSRGIWLTLTAPGTDALPWDRSLCTHSATVKCSGTAGCSVDGFALAGWHANLPLRWSHFVTELRRSLNPGLTGPPSTWPVQVEFFKTYEPQRRGALHVHAMLRVTGVCTYRRLVRACGKARRANGFGPQMKCESVDLSNSESGARIAGYCAKYCTKSSDALPLVKRLDCVTGELSEGGFRAWSASRQWGESMRSVQRKRTAWWASQRSSAARGSEQARCVDSTALDSYCANYADVTCGEQSHSPP